MLRITQPFFCYLSSCSQVFGLPNFRRSLIPQRESSKSKETFGQFGADTRQLQLSSGSCPSISGGHVSSVTYMVSQTLRCMYTGCLTVGEPSRCPAHTHACLLTPTEAPQVVGRHARICGQRTRHGTHPTLAVINPIGRREACNPNEKQNPPPLLSNMPFV